MQTAPYSLLDQALIPALKKRQEESLYRVRKVLASPQGIVVQIDGESYLSYCSNDYLGLANHPHVVAAFQRAAGVYGVGSGAAHLISGHNAAHQALEEELAEFTDRPRALLFCSGYMANLGTISALLNRSDAVFEDRLNHASLLDAGRHSGARFQRYPHLDIHSLTKRLTASQARRKLIVTDSVFSMDGDIAPLAALAECAKQHNAWLMVDDAHGLGVLGHHGGGSSEHYSLSVNEVPILMATLGKAFGVYGAFVAGSKALIETLIQQARTYIYTTALPPAIAEASRASLRIVKAEQWRRDKLTNRITQFRNGAQQLGFELLASSTPIQALIVGDNQQALSISQRLFEQGFLVSAIRSPTVPKGTARLRITLSAIHTEQQVNQLLSALESFS
ncbi:MAG: 8-amino-7-oxononanoate synthase [Gammaproteobacteria bacterium]|nr:8-amino-7-oxononanoate synthase [Gammaproteobacteria bacterium]